MAVPRPSDPDAAAPFFLLGLAFNRAPISEHLGRHPSCRSSRPPLAESTFTNPRAAAYSKKTVIVQHTPRCLAPSIEYRISSVAGFESALPDSPFLIRDNRIQVDGVSPSRPPLHNPATQNLASRRIIALPGRFSSSDTKMLSSVMSGKTNAWWLPRLSGF